MQIFGRTDGLQSVQWARTGTGTRTRTMMALALYSLVVLVYRAENYCWPAHLPLLAALACYWTSAAASAASSKREIICPQRSCRRVYFSCSILQIVLSSNCRETNIRLQQLPAEFFFFLHLDLLATTHNVFVRVLCPHMDKQTQDATAKVI